MIGQIINVGNETYTVSKYLGKGKSGYSYLITCGDKKLVYKQIHHEPCEHYNFGNKLMAEIHAYEKLKETGINIPRLIEYNEEKEYLIKEYIDGPTAAEMAAKRVLSHVHFDSAFQLAGQLYKNNFMVDFFPTNFVYSGNDVYLIDFEGHPYNEEWDFETWGIYFWLNSSGMEEHLEKGASTKLCLPGSPKPNKEGLEQIAVELIGKYSRKRGDTNGL